MRVRGGGRCVFGVVGPCWILLPGGRACCCWELNSLGGLTVERESRVSGPVAAGVGVVPESRGTREISCESAKTTW